MRDAKDLASEGADAERRGFSGTCENASLADWIQLIQTGRRDAVIAVRTPGNDEGRLWCKAGDIIDAHCDPFTGEDAVYQILSFQSGEVTVDFTAFERPRAIRTSLVGLLLESAYRNDTRVSETRGGSAQEGPHGASGGAPSTSTAPTVIGPPSLAPTRGRAQRVRTLCWSAAATATLAIALWLSWRAGSRAPAAASRALVTAASPMVDVPVHVEVQPDPITLKRLPPTATEPSPARFEDAVSRGARRVQLGHHAPSAAQDSKNGPTPALPPPALVSTTARKARIQTIDERQPRIQPIDDGRPAIESIE